MPRAYLRVQSGTPWAARGRDWAGPALNYLEPAGSHRNPAWTNLDVMAAYRLPLDTSVNVSLEARLLNVLNNQTRLSTDAQQYSRPSDAAELRRTSLRISSPIRFSARATASRRRGVCMSRPS